MRINFDYHNNNVDVNIVCVFKLSQQQIFQVNEDLNSSSNCYAISSQQEHLILFWKSSVLWKGYREVNQIYISLQLTKRLCRSCPTSTTTTTPTSWNVKIHWNCCFFFVSLQNMYKTFDLSFAFNFSYFANRFPEFDFRRGKVHLIDMSVTYAWEIEHTNLHSLVEWWCE